MVIARICVASKMKWRNKKKNKAFRLKRLILLYYYTFLHLEILTFFLLKNKHFALFVNGGLSQNRRSSFHIPSRDLPTVGWQRTFHVLKLPIDSDVNFQSSEQISAIFVQSCEQIEAKSVQPSKWNTTFVHLVHLFSKLYIRIYYILFILILYVYMI